MNSGKYDPLFMTNYATINVLDELSRIVGHEQRIIFSVFAVQHDELQYRRRFLVHGDSLELDLLGKLGNRGLDPIVDVDRVDVRIGAEFETDGERVGAVVTARALHVDHLVDADDLRFERLGDRGLEHLGGRPWIDRRHLYLWRHDIRELRNRNAREGKQPPERDNDSHDDRESRPIDEE